MSQSNNERCLVQVRKVLQSSLPDSTKHPIMQELLTEKALKDLTSAVSDQLITARNNESCSKLIHRFEQSSCAWP